jgi:hypothetical protein
VALATGVTMSVGFTGTREDLSNLQLSWLYQTFEIGVTEHSLSEVHHGACVGADLAVHRAALDNEIRVHVWPPTNMKLVAPECLVPHRLVTVHPRMPYLNRDREIVYVTQGLVALPKQNEQPDLVNWGGTWYTVDYAERLNRPIMIIYPNGDIESRAPLMKGHNTNG